MTQLLEVATRVALPNVGTVVKATCFSLNPTIVRQFVLATAEAARRDGLRLGGAEGELGFREPAVGLGILDGAIRSVGGREREGFMMLVLPIRGRYTVDTSVQPADFLCHSGAPYFVPHERKPGTKLQLQKSAKTVQRCHIVFIPYHSIPIKVTKFTANLVPGGHFVTC